MSLIPDSLLCPNCNGYMVERRWGLSSRCRCNDSRLVDPAHPPELAPSKRKNWL